MTNRLAGMADNNGSFRQSCPAVLSLVEEVKARLGVVETMVKLSEENNRREDLKVLRRDEHELKCILEDLVEMYDLETGP